jgi:tetratricopeptide (TPR) repeat protein
VFLAVPPDFREAVDYAAAAGQAGDLSLFAEEAGSFVWAITGLRLVGNTLFRMRRLELSREVWERVRERNPHDLEANLLLGTIYQRLGDLVRSDQALESALNSPKIDAAYSAEGHALLGRNAKQRWQDEWIGSAPDMQRSEALRSKFLGSTRARPTCVASRATGPSVSQPPTAVRSPGLEPSTWTRLAGSSCSIASSLC